MYFRKGRCYMIQFYKRVPQQQHFLYRISSISFTVKFVFVLVFDTCTNLLMQKKNNSFMLIFIITIQFSCQKLVQKLTIMQPGDFFFCIHLSLSTVSRQLHYHILSFLAMSSLGSGVSLSSFKFLGVHCKYFCGTQQC